MPVPAPKTDEYLHACEHILEKISHGDSLTSFESVRYAQQADSLKKSSPAESLQLRGLLALAQSDEAAFHRFFASALVATGDQTTVRSNYAMALVMFGDYEKATSELETMLRDPIAIFQHGCHDMCLAVCRHLENYDLAQKILEYAQQLGIADPPISGEIVSHLAAQLEDEDPLLLGMLDLHEWREISSSSEKTLQRLETLMAEVGDEHD